MWPFKKKVKLQPEAAPTTHETAVSTTTQVLTGLNGLPVMGTVRTHRKAHPTHTKLRISTPTPRPVESAPHKSEEDSDSGIAPALTGFLIGELLSESSGSTPDTISNFTPDPAPAEFQGFGDGESGGGGASGSWDAPSDGSSTDTSSSSSDSSSFDSSSSSSSDSGSSFDSGSSSGSDFSGSDF